MLVCLSYLSGAPRRSIQRESRRSTCLSGVSLPYYQPMFGFALITDKDGEDAVFEPKSMGIFDPNQCVAVRHLIYATNLSCAEALPCSLNGRPAASDDKLPKGGNQSVKFY